MFLCFFLSRFFVFFSFTLTDYHWSPLTKTHNYGHEWTDRFDEFRTIARRKHSIGKENLFESDKEEFDIKHVSIDWTFFLFARHWTGSSLRSIIIWKWTSSAIMLDNTWNSPRKNLRDEVCTSVFIRMMPASLARRGRRKMPVSEPRQSARWRRSVLVCAQVILQAQSFLTINKLLNRVDVHSFVECEPVMVCRDRRSIATV